MGCDPRVGTSALNDYLTTKLFQNDTGFKILILILLYELEKHICLTYFYGFVLQNATAL